MDRYAVNILHDENANGKIDKGFILPKEGIGFSNYSSVGPMNRPNFSKALLEDDVIVHRVPGVLKRKCILAFVKKSHPGGSVDWYARMTTLC